MCRGVAEGEQGEEGGRGARVCEWPWPQEVGNQVAPMASHSAIRKLLCAREGEEGGGLKLLPVFVSGCRV